MDALLWLLIVLILNTLMGAVGAITLYFRDRETLKFISYLLMAFAAGSLLGGAFLHLLPEASENMNIMLMFEITLIGFILFSLIESYLHFHRCKECNMHPFTYLVLIGDALHNIIDGIILAAAFIVDINIGIATSFVIIAHEIPQELGIFGVEVHGGMEKIKALVYSVLAQSTCIIGGIAGYFWFNSLSEYAAYLLPFAAGGFIYIASSDLIPELHKEEGVKRMYGIVMLFVGLLFMFGVKIMFGG